MTCFRWMLLFCVALLTIPCIAAPALASGLLIPTNQDDTENDPDPFMAAIAGEIRNELKTIFSVETGMQIDQQRQFFELDQQTVEKLETMGQTLVDSHVKLFTDEVILETWQRIGTGVGKGTTFKINGRECVLKGEERKDGGPEISMCMYKKSVLFSIKYQSGTTSTTLGHRLKFAPASSEPWLEVLSHLSDEDFQRFDQHQLDFKRDKIVDLLMASLTQQLRLSDEQIEPVRNWVLEKTTDLNLEQLGVVSGAKKALSQLGETEPECLTDSQRKVLKLMLSQAGYF